MRKKLWVFAILGLLSTKTLAQNKFEKGYYIDNKGNKTEGLIKNLDWRNNPQQFEFKTAESSKPEVLKMNSVKVFEIDNKVKFVKHKGNIDNSSTALSSLSSVKTPEYVEQEVFLKQVVEGNTNLYEYTTSDSKQFFYQEKEGEITPLIYKKYFVEENKVGENNEYKNQLKSIKGCGESSERNTDPVKYSSKDLVSFFVNLNSCEGGSKDYYNVSENNKRKFFHLTVRPGVNFSSYSIESRLFPEFYDVDFGNKTSFRIGVEAEFVLPFNNNKFAILLEPTYRYYNAEKVIDQSTNRKAEVKYSSLELPFGVRYYMFLSPKSKLFVNALGTFDLILGGSKIEYENTFSTPDLQSSMNFGFGVGYRYADRYNIEFRINTKRDMIPGGGIIESSDFKNFSLIFGYTLF